MAGTRSVSSGDALAIPIAAAHATSFTAQALGAQTEMRKAIEAAEQFLDGTDLTALHQAVQELAESNTATLEHQKAAQEAVTERFAALEGRLARLERSRQAQQEVQQQLDMVRASLPARKLTKLGLGAAQDGRRRV